MENPHKRMLNFKGTLEYSEFTWVHVDRYVFVGGLIEDHNEGLVVALHRSVWATEPSTSTDICSYVCNFPMKCACL